MVEYATNFFISFWNIAVTDPNDKVSAPKRAKKKLTKSVNSNRTANRIIKKTPATTKVEEWIKAEAGVGASIASGNHTWKKNWAAFIIPENTNEKEKIVKKWIDTLPINK